MNLSLPYAPLCGLLLVLFLFAASLLQNAYRPALQTAGAHLKRGSAFFGLLHRMALVDAQGTVTTPFPTPQAANAPVLVTAAVGGGSKPYHFVNSGTFTKQTVKAGAGTLYDINVYNGTGATLFLQIFDALAANITPGTTVPTLEYQVPSATQFSPPFEDEGVGFANGIVVFCSTAEKGSTGSAAGAVVDAHYI